MPPSSRKRRAPVDDDDDEPTPTQRRHTQAADDDHDDVDEANGESGSGSIAQLSKNLVRYAMSCEYSRTPIKRQDVNQKVLDTRSRSFKEVFAVANTHLMDVFGMRMVELPNREKVTLRQKRAAAGQDSQQKNSNMWVLQNILPEQYRTLDCMGPGIAPAEDESLPDVDGAYVGLYSMVISLILLSGGTLSDSKLDRYLKRMNAGENTPVDTTEKVLGRMAKDGYIVKIKESQGGEERIDYMVGPRGKMEVGKEGVMKLVRTVYGSDVEDLDQRLKRSLGLGEEADISVVNGDGTRSVDHGQEAADRPGRRQRQRDESEDE